MAIWETDFVADTLVSSDDVQFISSNSIEKVLHTRSSFYVILWWWRTNNKNN